MPVRLPSVAGDTGCRACINQSTSAAAKPSDLLYMTGWEIYPRKNSCLTTDYSSLIVLHLITRVQRPFWPPEWMEVGHHDEELARGARSEIRLRSTIQHTS